MGRRSSDQDLALLRETEALNPFSVKLKQRKPIWEEIAKRLKICELKVDMNGRCCKDRVTKLLKEFRSDETLSSKASGIEEEGLTELKDILGKISQLESCVSPKLDKLYAKQNRDTARKMQLEALQLMSDDAGDEEDLDAESKVSHEPKDSDSIADVGATEPPKKKIRKGDIVAYLTEKNKNELVFKGDELQVRKLEAENRALELQIRKEQQDADNKLKEAEQKERSQMMASIFEMLKK